MRTRGSNAKSNEKPRSDRRVGRAVASDASQRSRRPQQWEPLRASVDYWTWASKIAGIWWTRSAGAATIASARTSRFRALVDHARAHSPFYGELYRKLPAERFAPSDLPVATKRELMARFDDWATDRAITLESCAAFLGDRTQIGERYLGRYIVWKSSGTTGEPGIYVQDAEALATFDALMAAHFDPLRIALPARVPLFARGGRAALIAATGDHFASIASWQRLCRGSPWIAARGFSILDPLPKIVAELNAYQPEFVASYPTMLSVLAGERSAGRLKIDPLHLWSGGERLAPTMLAEIEAAFGAHVVNEYGASECMSIAYGCREGWLHVNADWVVLEPVDSDYRAVPPGELSHTVLLSNLANRVHPIIRYDLGDSVLASPEPCACGSPLPAIRVEGRHDDVVSLAAADGRRVRLLPLALTTVVEEAANITRFQIVQIDFDRLSLRLEPRESCDRQATWKAAAEGLRRYLAQQSLSNVQIELDDCSPMLDRRSGKLREVLVTLRESSSPSSVTEP